MDRRAAVEIVPILVRASQATADTVNICRRYGGDADGKAYSDTIGSIVGLYYDVLTRIIREHPDLDPGGFT